MTTTTPTTLWMNLNGRVACADHIGAEASALLAAKPQRRSISTTMTVWEPVSAADRADFVKYDLPEPTCESCDRDLVDASAYRAALDRAAATN